MKDERERALRVKAEMLECRHYTGTQHDVCKAGVNYRQLVGGPDLGWGTRLPCVQVFEAKNGERATCDQRSCWTPEEAEANVTAMDAAIDRHVGAHNKAHRDAKAKGLKKGHGGISECPCPVCDGGVIHYSVASYNGHMHAACDTQGCVSWME